MSLIKLTCDAYSVRDSFLFNFAFYGPSWTPVPTILGLRCLRHRDICCVQHVFDKYAIPSGGIIYEHVRHRADELAVLNDGRAAHECGQERTTLFNEKFTKRHTVMLAVCLVYMVAFNYLR